MLPQIDESSVDWRCSACRTLLGLVRGALLEVKYKTAVFEIQGSVTTRCRRCGTPSSFETSAIAPSAK